MARYSDVLLDHARDPRNAGEMQQPSATGRSSLKGSAPRTVLFLKLQDDVVQDARFQTFGCGVMVAACSVLTEMVKSKSIADCRRLRPVDLVAALQGMPQDKRFCADLALAALRDALDHLSATLKAESD